MAKQIEAGDRIVVRTASNETVTRIATSAELEGHRFPVVWACREEEWAAAQREGRAPDSVPWPSADVRLAEARGAA